MFNKFREAVFLNKDEVRERKQKVLPIDQTQYLK